MSEKSYPRPSQVTVAGWSLIVASAMLVPSIFDATGKLRSVETRSALEEALSSGSGRNLGIGLEQATELIRIALLVGGAAAAAMAILGWFVLKGDRSARIAVTVGIFPLMVAGPFAGGFLAAVAAAGVAMLWTRPARDWFAGREPRQPVPPRSGDGSGSSSGSTESREREHQHAGPRGEERAAETGVRVTAPVSPAPPVHGYGTPASGQPTQQPGQQPGSQPGSQQGQPMPGHEPWPPYQQPWPQAYGGPSAPERPRPVLTACMLTWVFSGITSGFGLILLFSLLVDPGRVVEVVVESVEARGDSLDPSWVQPGLWTTATLLVLWSAGAALLAYFVWRRQPWARIALVVSAVLAALLGVFAFPISLLHLGATAWTVGLLLSPVTREWFGRTSGPQ